MAPSKLSESSNIIIHCAIVDISGKSLRILHKKKKCMPPKKIISLVEVKKVSLVISY